MSRAPLTESELDIALEAIADFTDLKSIYFSGHSRGVAKLAADAARHAGFPERDVVVLRRAGLVHDLGRSGVPNTIWDKPGPLTFLEWERVRLRSRRRGPIEHLRKDCRQPRGAHLHER